MFKKIERASRRVQVHLGLIDPQEEARIQEVVISDSLEGMGRRLERLLREKHVLQLRYRDPSNSTDTKIRIYQECMRVQGDIDKLQLRMDMYRGIRSVARDTVETLDDMVNLKLVADSMANVAAAMEGEKDAVSDFHDDIEDAVEKIAEIKSEIQGRSYSIPADFDIPSLEMMDEMVLGDSADYLDENVFSTHRVSSPREEESLDAPQETTEQNRRKGNKQKAVLLSFDDKNKK